MASFLLSPLNAVSIYGFLTFTFLLLRISPAQTTDPVVILNLTNPDVPIGSVASMTSPIVDGTNLSAVIIEIQYNATYDMDPENLTLGIIDVRGEKETSYWSTTRVMNDTQGQTESLLFEVCVTDSFKISIASTIYPNNTRSSEVSIKNITMSKALVDGCPTPSKEMETSSKTPSPYTTVHPDSPPGQCTNETQGLPSCDFDSGLCPEYTPFMHGSRHSVPVNWTVTDDGNFTNPENYTDDHGQFMYTGLSWNNSISFFDIELNTTKMTAVCLEFKYRTVAKSGLLSVIHRIARSTYTVKQYQEIESETNWDEKFLEFCVLPKAKITFKYQGKPGGYIAINDIHLAKSDKYCPPLPTTPTTTTEVAATTRVETTATTPNTSTEALFETTSSQQPRSNGTTTAVVFSTQKDGTVETSTQSPSSTSTSVTSTTSTGGDDDVEITRLATITDSEQWIILIMAATLGGVSILMMVVYVILNHKMRASVRKRQKLQEEHRQLQLHQQLQLREQHQRQQKADDYSDYEGVETNACYY